MKKITMLLFASICYLSLLSSGKVIPSFDDICSSCIEPFAFDVDRGDVRSTSDSTTVFLVLEDEEIVTDFDVEMGGSYENP